MSHVMNTYARQPVAFVRGQGVWLWDEAGRKYLDALAGIAVSTLGYAHPKLTRALAEQAGRVIHTSNLFRIPQQEAAADRIAEISGLEEVFFCNSGCEANEAAIKIGRKYGHERGIQEPAIVVMENSFHGRTLATLSATGSRKVQAGFEPLVSGFVRVPYGDLGAVQKIAEINRNVAAVLVEPIQGEGGINVPDDDYLKKVRAWCDEQNILLILDEVQTGCGRTGKLFAYELFGVEPDIMTLGKGIGGGVPLSAFLAKEHAAVFTPGDHGTTYGGEPLTTRVGYEVMRYIVENDVPAQVAEKGKIVERRLSSLLDRCHDVTGIRGKGLMWAVEFSSDIGERITNAALENGLIINNVRPNAVRITPPLTVTEEELEQGLAVLEHVIEQDGASK